MQTENPKPVLLTLEVLASMVSENNQGRGYPNVLVFDPFTQTEIECTVWVYPPNVYYKGGDAFIITDVSSDSAAYGVAQKNNPNVEYYKYHRHLRQGGSPHEGSAILSRQTVEQILRNKAYTVS